MKLGSVSDIHIDFLKEDKNLSKHHRAGKELASREFDALVVCGDISTGRAFKMHFDAFCEGYGKPVYFVLGNHDLWFKHEPELWEEVKAFPGSLDFADVVELTPETALVGVTGWYDMRAGSYRDSLIIMPETEYANRFLSIAPEKVELPSTDGWGMGSRRRSRRFTYHWPMEKKEEFYRLCTDFADEQTLKFLPKLERAAKKYPYVFIATHFPMWEEACFNRKDGTLARDTKEGEDWLPWSVNLQLGMKVQALAEDYPYVNFTVLSGHTHAYGEAQILPNLRAYSHHVERYGHTPKSKTWVLK